MTTLEITNSGLERGVVFVYGLIYLQIRRKVCVYMLAPLTQ